MRKKNLDEDDLKKLLHYYQIGNFNDAEKLAIDISKKFPNHIFAWKLLVSVYYESGRFSEALKISRKTVTLEPRNSQLYFYLGNILRKLNRINEAKDNYKKALDINPNFNEAYINLGVSSEISNNLDDAKKYYKKAINLKSNNADLYFNLGNIYQKLNNFEDAEKSFKKAIDLKTNFPEAYYNLGETLVSLNKKSKAIEAFKKSIEFRPNFANSYLKLGNIFLEIRKFEDAENNLRHAIILNENLADAHVDLGWVLKEKGDLTDALECIKKGINLNQNIAMFFFKEGIIYHILGDNKKALKSLKKAHSIDQSSKIIQLVKNIFQKHENSSEIQNNNKNLENTFIKDRLNSEIFIANMPVAEDLIKYLYKVKFRYLDKEKPINDARYGNGLCSDFELFEDSSPVIKSLKKNLVDVIETALGSEIFIFASFFNILRGVSGTEPHRHLNSFDIDKSLNLYKRKYSLVYYLSVGDQSCTEPGILKLYDPSKEILPSKGKIVITSSSREHSSVYNGVRDRVMVGVNFYIL